MNGMRQRWWKAASLALVGGTVAAGSWFGFASAQPLPQQKSTPSADVPWVRSTSAPRVESPSEKVIPAANKFPAVPAPSSPAIVIPAGLVVPASAKVLVPVVTAPTSPVLGQPPTPTPTPPPPTAIPEFKAVPVPVPAVPGSIDPLPMPVPKVPAVPAAPTVPKVDESFKPAITPPLNVPPPSPPSNSTDPVKPMLPLPADLNLRPMIGGNSVKTDGPMTPTVPVPLPTTNLVPTAPLPATNVVPTAPLPLPIPTMPDTIPALPTGSGSVSPMVPVIPGSRTKPTETPMAPTEKYVFPLPLPSTNTLTTTPGDSPMMHSPTAMAALTGFALAFGPSALADEPTKADPVEIAKKLDATIKKLEDADKEIKRLQSLLEGKKDEKGFILPTDPGAVSEIKALKDKINQLQTQLNEIKSNSTSLKPPVPALTGKGTVRVVNEYAIPVSIVINDKNYRVEPSTTLNVDVPVGDFSYQLLQSGAPATKSTVKEKEVVTLRVK